MPTPKKHRKKRTAPKHPAPGKKAGLTPQQARFIELLVLEGKTGTDSAIGAGYSSKTAAQKAHELTHKNLHVMEAIKTARAELSEASKITREKWVQLMEHLSFADRTALFAPDGSLKTIAQMDEKTRLLIDGMEVSEITVAGIPMGVLKKVKTPQRLDAMALLGKAQGWVVDRKELTGKDGAPLVPPQEMDLTQLTTDELDALRGLLAKAKAPNAPPLP